MVICFDCLVFINVIDAHFAGTREVYNIVGNIKGVIYIYILMILNTYGWMGRKTN